jgi:hypothetical protein
VKSRYISGTEVVSIGRFAARSRVWTGTKGRAVAASPLSLQNPYLGVGAAVAADYVKPTFRKKCPNRRFMAPPPAQCTMNASRMMARIMTTNQMKNTTIPGRAYPATVLALSHRLRLPGTAGIIHHRIELTLGVL